MAVQKLWIRDVRCLEEVTLEAADKNLVFGENASGKTSLLEALFVLGRGRSFRGAQREGLIRDGQPQALISARVQRAEQTAQLGLGLNRGGPPQVRINGQDENSAAMLAEWLPVQVLDPELHRLVEEGPGVRRRFMDWGVFHVEHAFLEHWRRYQRALRQRNAALRQKPPADLEIWDEQLSTEGEALSGQRQAYLTELQPEVQRIGRHLLGADIRMEYRPGWPDGKTLAESLAQSRDRDRRFGATHTGPHRADLTIDIEKRRARGRVSRGQQKLLAASLVLGQLRNLEVRKDLRSVLLLDDIAAELDAGSLSRLMEAVTDLGSQLFVTALDRRDVPIEGEHAVFHVEQGKVLSVV
ncbi:MAG: DNA replication/repair protein RecF [Gammaproteobacteria bacterium]